MGNFVSNIFDNSARIDDDKHEAAIANNIRLAENNQPQRVPSFRSNSPTFSEYPITPITADQRRITHYRSSQKILLVGEGDFSFSACLARTFGSATNMVATSLDSEEELLEKYWRSNKHIQELRSMGCMVLHDVGVHDMLYDPVLKNMKFDRIVFNFPHAGHFPPLYETDAFLIQMHMKLLSGFFKSSSKMLNENGEVHVTHRDDYPYNKWEIEKLANRAGLRLLEKVRFRKVDYPGYSNKRGGDVESDKEFYLGDRPYTFKFTYNSKLTTPN